MHNLPTIRHKNTPQPLTPVIHEAEKIVLAFPGMSMNAFMRQTMAYEDLPVPFSQRLRQGAWVGMTMTLVTTTFLLLLIIFPQIQTLLNQLPVIALAGLLHSDVQWMAKTPLLAIGDGLLLCSGTFLLVVTRNLQAGKPALHWLALAEALGGCANALLFAVPVAILGLNVLLWILILLAILVVIGLVLGVLFAFMA
jgi:hypothetical protein